MEDCGVLDVGRELAVGAGVDGGGGFQRKKESGKSRVRVRVHSIVPILVARAR